MTVSNVFSGSGSNNHEGLASGLISFIIGKFFSVQMLEIGHSRSLSIVYRSRTNSVFKMYFDVYNLAQSFIMRALVSNNVYYCISI